MLSKSYYLFVWARWIYRFRGNKWDHVALTTDFMLPGKFCSSYHQHFRCAIKATSYKLWHWQILHMRKCFFTAERTNRRVIKRKQKMLWLKTREFFYRHVSIFWIKGGQKYIYLELKAKSNSLWLEEIGFQSVTEQLLSTAGNKTDQNCLFFHL